MTAIEALTGDESTNGDAYACKYELARRNQQNNSSGILRFVKSNVE